MAVRMNYWKKFKTPDVLRKFGHLANARYLVDERDLDLPAVFQSKTYKIYDLM